MKNPCIKVCKFEGDVCRGCGRTTAEIKRWKKLDSQAQRAVLAHADMRLLTLAALNLRKK